MFAGCRYQLEEEELLLIDYNPDYPNNADASKQCHFQQFDGSHISEDVLHCNKSDPAPENTDVLFACKKELPCSEIQPYDCIDDPADSSSCYVDLGNGTFTDLADKCSSYGGSLPRPTSPGALLALDDLFGNDTEVWIGLTHNTTR